MIITTRHRRIAHAIWECGGRLEDVAAREGVGADTLRRWLTDPAFRSLVAQDALEPLLQATSAMLRWAPAAVARLIQDLESDSASDARQAAREILRIALDTQRELARPAAAEGPGEALGATDPLAALANDPLGRRVADLSDEQLGRVLAILNENQGDTR